MELVKHGKTLIQLTMDVLSGLIINVKHAQLNTILTPTKSVLQSVLNAVNGMPTDNVLHATLDILLITEHVLLTQVLLEQVMLPPTLTVTHGIMEYVKHVLIDIGLMLMEFVNMLQINVILGITLMDYV